MSDPASDPARVEWDADAFRERIRRALDEFLDRQASHLAPLGEDAARLVAEARTCISGGKRFRAAFCYWGYRGIRPQITNGADGADDADDAEDAEDEALVRACAGLELLHASALVHDDFMDSSDTRRGRPATHRTFEAEHRTSGWTGDPQQYGAAAAILLGDLLLGWAGDMLRDCGLPRADVDAAMSVFELCRTEVIAGQFLDISVQARAHADAGLAMTVLRYKSAKYSIERPLEIGAALAGATLEQRSELAAFGLPLGEAFQLRDDLLGVFGDPALTGKPAGDDLVEGKRTVLVALALEAADAAEARVLDASLGRPLTDEAVAELRRIIETSGAPAQVEQLIASLADTGVAALTGARIDSHARGVLTRLASAATQRTM